MNLVKIFISDEHAQHIPETRVPALVMLCTTTSDIKLEAGENSGNIPIRCNNTKTNQ